MRWETLGVGSELRAILQQWKQERATGTSPACRPVALRGYFLPLFAPGAGLANVFCTLLAVASVFGLSALGFLLSRLPFVFPLAMLISFVWTVSPIE